MSDQSEFAVILDRALSGDVQAMFNVAECYVEGTGAPISTKQALYWYKRAANKGDVDSMFELARFYCDGIGVVQDIPTAHHWLTKAYDSGHLIKTGNASLAMRRAEVARLLMSFEPPK